MLSVELYKAKDSTPTTRQKQDTTSWITLSTTQKQKNI